METATVKSLFGHFYGCDFTFDTLERMALRPVETFQPGLRKHERTADKAIRRPLVNDKMIQPESGLYRTKWFDYRRLHPVMATFLFAHCYNQGVKRAWRRHIDHKAAESIKGFPGINVFQLGLTSLAGFWKARQTADMLGMPYDFFINRGMDLALDGGWSQLPRPSQLYDADNLARISMAWDEWTAARLQCARDPWYRLENFVGHRDQLAHQDWLLAQARKRPLPEFMLYEVCLQRPMLPLERVAQVFGEGKVETIRKIAASH